MSLPCELSVITRTVGLRLGAAVAMTDVMRPAWSMHMAIGEVSGQRGWEHNDPSQESALPWSQSVLNGFLIASKLMIIIADVNCKAFRIQGSFLNYQYGASP